jgi:hypothetical protein
MVISRSQMTRQLEPGLGKSWKGKYKKVVKKAHGQKIKSNSKRSKV